MTEKDGDGEKHRPRGAAGNGVFLVPGQPDCILLMVNKDKPRSGTQHTSRKASIFILRWPKYLLLHVSFS